MSAPAPLAERISTAYRGFRYVTGANGLEWSLNGLHQLYDRAALPVRMRAFRLIALNDDGEFQTAYDAILEAAHAFLVVASGIYRELDARFRANDVGMDRMKQLIEDLRLRILYTLLRSNEVSNELSVEAVAALAASFGRLEVVPMDLFPVESYFDSSSRLVQVLDACIRGEHRLLPLLRHYENVMPREKRVGFALWGENSGSPNVRLRMQVMQTLRVMRKRGWKLDEPRDVVRTVHRSIGSEPSPSALRVLSNVVFGLMERVERERMVHHFLNNSTMLGEHSNVLLGLVAPVTTTADELEMKVYVNMVVWSTEARNFGGLNAAGVWTSHTRHELSIELNAARDISKLVAEYNGMPTGLGSDWDNRQHEQPKSDLQAMLKEQKS